MEGTTQSPYLNAEIDEGTSGANGHAIGTEAVGEAVGEGQETSSKKQKIIRLTLFLLLLSFIIFVIVDSLREQHVKRITQEFLKWVEENPAAGIFSFIGVYFLATSKYIILFLQLYFSIQLFSDLTYTQPHYAAVLFIPGSILTLGSGFVFANVFGLGLGLVFSTVAVFVGASSGATAAFLLARYLFQDSIQKLSTRFQTFQAVDTALQTEGLKIMVLLRLSPIIPFNAINYILGVTSVSLKDYVLACFAMLPGTILYTFLGSSAGSIVDSASSGSGNIKLTVVVIVLGIVFGVLGIAVTTYYAKKELKKIIDNQNEVETSEDAVQIET
jgi:uncharacterized membrane protein YdjX (TVP38/TMEM64 family)